MNDTSGNGHIMTGYDQTMVNKDILDTNRTIICLPDFFQKEFPNLTKFLKENLLDMFEKKNEIKSYD